MRIETVKVYKGKSCVIINKTEEDLKEYNDNGYFTSSQRQKAAKDKKEAEKLAKEEEVANDPKAAEAKEAQEAKEKEETEALIKLTDEAKEIGVTIPEGATLEEMETLIEAFKKNAENGGDGK